MQACLRCVDSTIGNGQEQRLPALHTANYLSGAAVLSCLPIAEQIETFGRVTLEAMSCGLPCVVNKECGEHLVKVCRLTVRPLFSAYASSA